MKRDIRIGDKTRTIISDDQYLERMPDTFEPEMTALFKALVQPDMVVADVGANIGMTGLLFSDLARKTFAFEPAPSTFALLRDNIAAGGADNVEVHNLGMGDAPATQTITFAPNNRSGGFVSDTTKLAGGHTTETIQVETLDGFFFDRPGERPDFIKLDVEGFEPRVLRGAGALIAAKKPTVVLELNHFCLNVLHRVSLPDFLDQLRALFPILLAVDTDNSRLAGLHNPDIAYMVMNQHVNRFRFPNIVAGFDPEIGPRLNALVENRQA